MGATTRPVIETRSDQMFPTLEPSEIDRLRRFGEQRAYSAELDQSYPMALTATPAWRR